MFPRKATTAATWSSLSQRYMGLVALRDDRPEQHIDEYAGKRG
jgi:hypothetical protein